MRVGNRICVGILAVLAAIVIAEPERVIKAVTSATAASTAPSETTNMAVKLLTPLNGSVVSNHITLSASVTTLVNPIERVEFYCDGKLIGIVTNVPKPPTGLRIE